MEKLSVVMIKERKVNVKSQKGVFQVLKKEVKSRWFQMTSTLGIVTLNAQHEEAFTCQLAKAAASFDLEIVRFTPFDLKPGSNLIQGQTYKLGNGFSAAEFPIPDLIYDRCL